MAGRFPQPKFSGNIQAFPWSTVWLGLDEYVPSRRSPEGREWRALWRPGNLEKSAFRRADGQYRWFLIRAVPLRDRQRNVVRWYGTSTDIEDLKRPKIASAHHQQMPMMAWTLRPTAWLISSISVVWTMRAFPCGAN